MPHKYSQRVKAKPPYLKKDGTRIPGVTTIVRVAANSEWKVKWAAKLAFDGIDPVRYRDEKGNVGTLAHALCLSPFGGTPPDLSEYTPREVQEARNAEGKWLAWLKGHSLEPVLVEKPLVSEKLSFGGTPDIYGNVDGLLTLVDLKSGAGIYSEAWTQLAGYNILLNELGHNVEQRIILNIGRDETENFVEAKRSGPALDDEIEIFMACLAIYEAKKRLKID